MNPSQRHPCVPDPEGRPAVRPVRCVVALALAGLAGTAEPLPRPDPTPPAAEPPPATRPVADPVAEVRVAATAAEAALAGAIDDAAFLLAAGRAREAGERLGGAIAVATGADPARLAQAAALLARIRAAESTADLSAGGEVRTAAAAAERSLAEVRQQAASSLRGERLARIRDLAGRDLVELALAHCRTLLTDLPGDAEVEDLFRTLLARAHTLRRASIAEREAELREELALYAERSLIPEGFDGRPRFPGDWETRRAGRRSPLDVAEEMPPWQQRLTDRLQERISLVFDATPVAEAAALAAQLGGVNILVGPELQAATDRKITLRAVGMRLEDVISWIASQAGTRFSIANEAVYIGDARLEKSLTALHDVSELLIGAQDFPGPVLSFTASGGSGNPVGFGQEAPTAAAAPTADDIAELIRRTVSPRTWSEDGNGIVVRSQTLFITAPESVQRLVREFLRAQSAQRSLAVRIEVRWLELSDRYVEEIGVHWTNQRGPLIDGGVGNRFGFLRQLDGWQAEGSTTNPLPASAMTIAPATAGTGLSLQAAMLHGTRLNAVLQAVERNAQGRVLNAPELVCLNGMQANAYFGQQLAYIGDYQISGTMDPVISVLNLGTALEIRPIVSADRKYVTLELSSSVASATLWTEYITGVLIGQNYGYNGITYPLELPNVAVQSARTGVMLPDGGSLLIGGFARSLDQFSATRVPLLGSVPFLGRLFGARGRYADRTKLFLLATATIINYPELEARL